MSRVKDTKELEEYLEANAAQLVETDDDKNEIMRLARADTRKRIQRAERMRKLRRDNLKMTQQGLAKAVGANVRTLQGWESGRQEYPKSVEILMELIKDIPTVRKRLVHG